MQTVMVMSQTVLPTIHTIWVGRVLTCKSALLSIKWACPRVSHDRWDRDIVYALKFRWLQLQIPVPAQSRG